MPIDRLHRTLLDEHLRIQGSTAWHETVEEMQASFAWLEHYHQERPLSGKYRIVQHVRALPPPAYRLENSTRIIEERHNTTKYIPSHLSATKFRSQYD